MSQILVKPNSPHQKVGRSWSNDSNRVARQLNAHALAHGGTLRPSCLKERNQFLFFSGQQQQQHAALRFKQSRGSVAMNATSSGVILGKSSTDAPAIDARDSIEPRDSKLFEKQTDLASAEELQEAEGEKKDPLSKVSFGTLGVSAGLVLVTLGFLELYFPGFPGQDFAPLILITGFIVSSTGFSFKYSELAPLNLNTSRRALGLRKNQSTPFMNQLREDTTRYRYGDDTHLEEAIKIIFKADRPGGIKAKVLPKLLRLSEEVTATGKYTLGMGFTAPKIKPLQWQTFRQKFETFFGPGVSAVLRTGPKVGDMDVLLISEDPDKFAGPENPGELFPPLVPGLPIRTQRDENDEEDTAASTAARPDGDK